MPRVRSAKANKDYLDHDIKKGDTYYHWTPYRGRKRYSKTMPRRSQTTGSATLAGAYACEEGLTDALAEANTVEDVVAAIDDAVSAADEAISEYEDSISNLEDAWPNGCPALEEKTEQRDSLESWKDELESAKNDIEALDPADYEDEDDVDIAMFEAACELANAVSFDL